MPKLHPLNPKRRQPKLVHPNAIANSLWPQDNHEDPPNTPTGITAKTPTETSQRVANGTFAPGNTMGALSARTRGVSVDVLLREGLEARADEYVGTVLGKAIGGDYRFAELAVNRAYGTPVHREVQITASAAMDQLVEGLKVGIADLIGPDRFGGLLGGPNAPLTGEEPADTVAPEPAPEEPIEET